MLRRLLILASVLTALIAPATARAITVQELTFSSNEVNAQWRGLGPISMEQKADGILLTSHGGTGAFLTDSELLVFPQAAILITDNPVPANVYFVWIYTDDAAHISYDVPVNVAPGKDMINSFALASHDKWNKGEKSIGLALPPGTSIVLKKIQLVQWEPWERAVELWKSFWTFDSYTPYSINFVWGPFLANNTIQRKSMFTTAQPDGDSAVYAILILTVVVLAALSIKEMWLATHGKRRNRIARRSIVVLGVVWLLLDLRMGSEFLSWVKADSATYITAREETRTFRERGRFYDFAAFAAPLVADRPSYIFFAQQMWPYLGNIRYLTYPSIPGNRIEQDDTWVIYARPDISVNSANQLTMDGQPLSDPGRVLGRFDGESFVFRVSPK